MRRGCLPVFALLLAGFLAGTGCGAEKRAAKAGSCAGGACSAPGVDTMRYEIEKTDEEWKQELTPEQYTVTRLRGTEPPWSGTLLHNKKEGTYLCIACGEALFASRDKYDSGSGWPSFTRTLRPDRAAEIEDRSLGMRRTEVVCHRCGAHLGHLFDDGPAPTGRRYCINSAALRFEKAEEKAENRR